MQDPGSMAATFASGSFPNPHDGLVSPLGHAGSQKNYFFGAGNEGYSAL